MSNFTAAKQEITHNDESRPKKNYEKNIKQKI